ncbi:MAG: excinuclease ABC subunit A [Candidatus Accumulibacter sp. 66-26]|nr:excinuclease ABC subunit A [Accumulibacter sp.]OJW52049.1 MAG: excinuclease ABC subunit A [Candidatus Accumulibacter sp. 66-26]
MKRLLKISALLSALLIAGSAAARDDQNMFPLEDALNLPAAKSKLDPDIRLYFGNQKHPKVAKELGEWKTNKKTNGFNKTDKEACEWVFLSAVLELQERAQKEGGNAVVGIKSNYKSIERSSETEYMCGSGALMSGVALKGKVVKLAN